MSQDRSFPQPGDTAWISWAADQHGSARAESRVFSVKVHAVEATEKGPVIRVPDGSGPPGTLTYYWPAVYHETKAEAYARAAEAVRLQLGRLKDRYRRLRPLVDEFERLAEMEGAGA